MRSDASVRKVRRPLYRVIAGDWRRAAIAAATLATIMALGTFAGGKLFGPAHKSSNPETAQKGGAGWGHRVGSILFVPADGDMCEQRRFDNASGRMLSLGYVKCTDGVAQGDSGEPSWARDNTSRINAILSAFKK
ncbi:MAG TPA: hypothetical protein VFL51_03080 [Pseudolabrys sp.]|nr:hypothetical protein [Pseudolabrys sp.]